MDLEEKTLDPAVPERCQVCGAQLIPSEQQAVLDSGSPPLCSIHAVEDLPMDEESAEHEA
jgi:hypothetical protein